MKKYYLLLGIINTLCVFAQTITGTVYSKGSQEVVPYAKIGIVNENIGIQADEKGQYTLKLDNVSRDKQLMILVGGYETYKVTVADFIKNNPHPIYLEPKVINIQEVAITPSYKEKNMGVNSKSKSIMFTPNMEKGNDVIEETAVGFKTSKKLKIMKINMNFARFDSSTPVKVRYTIYSEKDGKPDQLILNKEIIETISQSQITNQTFSLDVSKDNIWMQGNFYVGIQFIGQASAKVALSGALFHSGFYRSFYGAWEKIGMAAPAINIDVKIKK
ncbi:carboxypeptidase-like regulatory domain-containing protein [Elizabethkingia bruuniana]|uniref:Carboxypeptidase-like regulatory domain-containing protein n=1 Tax=Elizabethkingia bruuniana TaxID=1756149 RepID=A0A7T7V0W2_9FLAO|nr:carboxypeptidase-like regulatory domain-containing protein [Elizabethkingia bruuniana]KGO09470.1 hypothetical protein KS04_14715 [Elizabethkingia miricola]AQX86056.1 hypothetical protein AYC65_14050 [Elizabethkingia bruuniana]KUY27712.1 hypothetical protein ATB97_18645 [Elizabethkingia bruuniana]OPB63566.1 hypothetical protein BAY12_09200 [Elizabethkingia bruuniana]QQN59763.1 carboxypeptidase-like regulatory domain-containing protein [Elizabethkingia bruuniana]